MTTRTSRSATTTGGFPISASRQRGGIGVLAAERALFRERQHLQVVGHGRQPKAQVVARGGLLGGDYPRRRGEQGRDLGERRRTRAPYPLVVAEAVVHGYPDARRQRRKRADPAAHVVSLVTGGGGHGQRARGAGRVQVRRRPEGVPQGRRRRPSRPPLTARQRPHERGRLRMGTQPDPGDLQAEQVLPRESAVICTASTQPMECPIRKTPAPRGRPARNDSIVAYARPTRLATVGIRSVYGAEAPYPGRSSAMTVNPSAAPAVSSDSRGETGESKYPDVTAPPCRATTTARGRGASDISADIGMPSTTTARETERAPGAPETTLAVTCPPAAAARRSG